MKSPLQNAISPFRNAKRKVHEAIKGVQEATSKEYVDLTKLGPNRSFQFENK